MSKFPPTTKDPLFLTGIALVALSFILFVIPLFFPSFLAQRHEGMFMVNYLLTVMYLVMMIANGLLKRRIRTFRPLLLLLLLALISAYALNREMGVFERSANWFCVVLMVIGTNYLLFYFVEEMPAWARMVLCTVAGFAMLVFVYLAIYLLPIYPISVATFLGLGLSLHAFVPLLFCIYTVVLIRKVSQTAKIYRNAFITGMVVPFMFVAGYVINWNSQLSVINQGFRYSSITENDQLPAWIRVAQQMSKNKVSEKVLKTDLVYSVPERWKSGSFFRLPDLNFEQKVHDPLVMVSSFICGEVHLPKEKRIKILECLYDSRHQAQERLWSGEDIVTERVATNVQLWPKLRLSYCETNLTITNAPSNNSWTNQQEAIYTFHLPEGGVVTSLSLWIEGKEEKGILTSKAKADSAYNTIVGAEGRDPSVVHWQEGNTVTVRVFPVLKGESRKFRIGITAPLQWQNNQLRYNDIWFDGPSFRSAEENIEIAIKDPVAGMIIPGGFTSKGNQVYHNGHYSPGWSVAFAAPPLSADTFSFDNHIYQMTPIEKLSTALNAKNFYLDINASWPAEMCEQAYQLARQGKVFVSEGEETLTEVTEGNKNRLFSALRNNQFSIFPFHKIADGQSSLVITHSGPVSPSIDDLRGSHFLEQASGYFKDKRTLKVFDLGEEQSPYLKSLKEFRALDYERGDEKRLKELLAANTFNKTLETDNAVAVESAGITIRKADGNTASTAPDHLMRLFAYNHIMYQSGRQLLPDTAGDSAMVDEARQAYVVSPVSSLVVLETQTDYDRFDITSSRNSLQNANLKSTGAVPEPGEWALIILVALLAGVIKFYPRLSLLRK